MSITGLHTWIVTSQTEKLIFSNHEFLYIAKNSCYDLKTYISGLGSCIFWKLVEFYAIKMAHEK